MKKLLVILALAAIVIAGIFAFKMYTKKHDDLAGIKADFKISSSSFFQEFSNNEVEANEKYLNKIIEISGEISKISTDDDSGITQIYLKSDDPMFGVICDMNPEEKIKLVKVGQTVIIKGVCSGYLMDVALNRCIQIK